MVSQDLRRDIPSAGPTEVGLKRLEGLTLLSRNTVFCKGFEKEASQLVSSAVNEHQLVTRDVRLERWEA